MRQWRDRPFRGSGCRFRNGDTLLARISPCLENGKTAFVEGLAAGAVGHGSTEFIVLAARAGLADPLFVYYLARGPHFRRRAVGLMAGSSGRQRVSADALARLDVLVPPLAEQRALAGLLGAIDDKIELNRRRAAALRELAGAVFQSWFVDFDPVRGAAGTGPEGAALFPRRLVPSAVGPVPHGWRIAPLEKVAAVERGLSYRGADLAEWGSPLHNLNSVREGGGYKDEGLKFLAGPAAGRRGRGAVRPGDVLVANTEQGHGQRLIGYPALVPRRFGPEGLFSHHLYRLRPRAGGPLTAHFLYLLLLTESFRRQVTAHANGTTVNMLPADGLRRPLLAVPPAALVRRFGQVVDPLFEGAEAADEESMSLAALREALLPGLLAGAVRVGEAPLL